MTGLSGGDMSGSSASIPIDVLADPQALQKRIDQFTEAQSKAQEVVDLAGPASEILQLRERIGKQLDEEEARAREIKAQCDEMVADAEVLATVTLDKAQTKAAELVDKVKARLAVADVKVAEANELMQKAKQDASVVKADHQWNHTKAAELEQRTAELDKKETQLLNEKSELVAVYEHMRKVLE